MTRTSAKIPAERINRAADGVTGDPDKAFGEAKTTIEGTYGNAVITHCCLESHGQIAEWTDAQNVLLHPSTQSVSSVGGQLAQSLKIPAGNVRVKMDHIGGGFGSKFQIDRWGVECANLSKLAQNKPVKMMLERDAELMVAGTRPSIYAKVKVAAEPTVRSSPGSQRRGVRVECKVSGRCRCRTCLLESRISDAVRRLLQPIRVPRVPGGRRTIRRSR